MGWGFIGDIFDAVGDVVEGAVDIVDDIADGIGDIAGDAIHAVGDFANSDIGKVVSFFLPTPYRLALTAVGAGTAYYDAKEYAKDQKAAYLDAQKRAKVAALAGTTPGTADISFGGTSMSSGSSLTGLMDKYKELQNQLGKYPGASDLRVLDAYMKSKNSSNPAIASTFGAVKPSVSATEEPEEGEEDNTYTTQLSSAQIG